MIFLHLYISESRSFWFEKYDINKQFQRVLCNIILYFSSFNFILYPCIEKSVVVSIVGMATMYISSLKLPVSMKSTMMMGTRMIVTKD